MADREIRDGTRHPLDCIAEWRKGCSCGGPMLDRIEGKPIGTSSPAECVECTEGLIAAIEKWHGPDA